MKKLMQENKCGLDATSRWAIIVSCFVSIDLLFLPYFQYIIIPYSLPVILMALAMDERIFLPRNSKRMLGTISALVLLSVLFSLVLPNSSNHAVENIKRMFQFVMSFAYFLYFYNLARRFGLHVINVKIYFVFLLYYFALTALFFIDPSATYEFISDLYGRLVTDQGTVLEQSRFAYLFTDPNSAAYFLLIATMPLFQLLKTKLNKLVTLILLLLCLLISRSRGAMLALFICGAMSLVPWSIFYERISLLRFNKFLFATLLIFLVLVLSNFVIEDSIFGNGGIVGGSIERLSDKDAYAEGGYRFKIWSMYASQLIPLPLGRGYMFDVDNSNFYPHSDFLRLTYSYGFIVALGTVYFCFRHIFKIPLLVIPAIIAFSINSLIDEQKIFALFLCFLGMYYGGAFNGPIDATERDSGNADRNF